MRREYADGDDVKNYRKLEHKVGRCAQWYYSGCIDSDFSNKQDLVGKLSPTLHNIIRSTMIKH